MYSSDNSVVSFYMAEDSAVVEYVFNFLETSLGIPFRRVGEICDAQIVYADLVPHSERCIVIPVRPEDVLWRDLISDPCAASVDLRKLPFDVINAISLFLTDQVNRDAAPEAFDPKERLQFGHSFQERNSVGPIAVVDLYVNVISKALEEVLGILPKPLWPDGKRCAVNLSHDVDIPDRLAILKAPFMRSTFPLKMRIELFLRQVKAILVTILGRKRSDYWCFPETLHEESRRGFASTYYFAPTRKRDAAGTEHDVDYDMREPRYQDVLEQLREGDWEIGLHAGYDAYKSSDNFIAEKEHIETLAKVKVKGLRHHCWHTGKDVDRTLLLHETAGFEYDSSVAFNDGVGFRRSVSLPFFPWSNSEGRPLRTLQIPVACMDGALFRKHKDAQSAFEEVVSLIEGIRASGGTAVLNWHSRNTHPKNELKLWGQTYLLLLDWLAGQDDIWVAPVADINDWWRARGQRPFQAGEF